MPQATHCDALSKITVTLLTPCLYFLLIDLIKPPTQSHHHSFLTPVFLDLFQNLYLLNVAFFFGEDNGNPL